MFQQPYTVPVAYLDLPPAEALLQAFDNLAQLQGIIGDAFSRLSARVQHEKSRLTNIRDRVDRAKVKVQTVAANQSKVTTVLSTARYPAPKLLPDYPSVFPSNDIGDETIFAKPIHSNYQLTQSQRHVEQKPCDTTDLFMELTQNSAVRRQKEKLETELSREGLGRLPAQLPSISSVLLFNSDENPYKKYESLDNLEGVGGTDREKETKDKVLAEAPHSILTGIELPTFSGLQYDFKPNLGTVPTFQAPTNLPLSRLADLTFGAGGSNFHIAPSATPLASLPSAAELLALPGPAPSKTTQPQQLSAFTSTAFYSSSSSSSSSSSFSSPSSIPPPPSLSSSSSPSTVTVLGASQPSTANVPVAPPPPTPVDVPSSTPSSAPTQAPAEASSDDNNRSALMDAIRKAGMSALKKAKKDSGDKKGGKKSGGAGKDKKAAADKKGESEREPVSTGNNLMDALRQRLKQRHDAMSGKSDRDEKRALDTEKKAPAFTFPILKKTNKDNKDSKEAKDLKDDDAKSGSLIDILRDVAAKRQKQSGLSSSSSDRDPSSATDADDSDWHTGSS
eukprot:TRINITY_DN619_c5_g1_i1.p1 TRINITY_DN619_c5_g1~~TRINITY_DN619_c5_g1_i1.p1  ORF type:complete len:562 (+),score=177.50 TRINITY_DN619_c5_g1_i1:102-1787(+)